MLFLIKMRARVCYYVGSKQNVRDKVGNIIKPFFLMAENLNGYFSSVFTTDNISSLPVH